ncbi:MAG: PspC domain-containing protein [Actinomycetota bacterium]
MSQEPKRLYRSRTNRMLCGLCGGLAEYFNIDVTIVRIGAVILAVAGPGLIAYLIAWLIVPEEPLDTA